MHSSKPRCHVAARQTEADAAGREHGGPAALQPTPALARRWHCQPAGAQPLPRRHSDQGCARSRGRCVRLLGCRHAACLSLPLVLPLVWTGCCRQGPSACGAAWYPDQCSQTAATVCCAPTATASDTRSMPAGNEMDVSRFSSYIDNTRALVRPHQGNGGCWFCVGHMQRENMQ